MNIMSTIAYLFADGESAASGGNNKQSIIFIVILAVMIVAMVLLTIIPNKRKQKEYQKMQDELRPGTKIMTIGRMIGTVVRVYDNNTLEVDVGTAEAPVIITINREAVGINLDAQAAAQAAKEVKHVESKEAKETEAQTETAEAIADEKSDIPEEKSDISDDAI